MTPTDLDPDAQDSIEVQVLKEFAEAHQYGSERHHHLTFPGALGQEGRRREWRRKQKARGLCAFCTMPYPPDQENNAVPRCIEHRKLANEYQRVASRRTPKKVRDRTARFRASQFAKGLCAYCPCPVQEGRRSCPSHLAKQRKSAERKKSARHASV